MTWDEWPVTVLAMTLTCVVSPTWATMAVQLGGPARFYRHALMQAGGGAAMLTLAVYLVNQAPSVIGRSYWDLPLRALGSPFMRSMPDVWVPTFCWVMLVVLGTWWIVAGVTVRRGPRDVAAMVWALNEAVIAGSLLTWHVYAPETWIYATLLSFALKGLYMSCLVGALLRLVMAAAGLGIAVAGSNSPYLRSHYSMSYFDRMRRF